MLRLWGRLSCGEYRGSKVRNRLKATVMIGMRPTHLSVTCFPTSLNGFFGLKAQRLIWL